MFLLILSVIQEKILVVSDIKGKLCEAPVYRVSGINCRAEWYMKYSIYIQNLSSGGNTV